MTSAAVVPPILEFTYLNRVHAPHVDKRGDLGEGRITLLAPVRAAHLKLPFAREGGVISVGDGDEEEVFLRRDGEGLALVEEARDGRVHERRVVVRCPSHEVGPGLRVAQELRRAMVVQRLIHLAVFLMPGAPVCGLALSGLCPCEI